MRYRTLFCALSLLTILALIQHRGNRHRVVSSDGRSRSHESLQSASERALSSISYRQFLPPQSTSLNLRCLPPNLQKWATAASLARLDWSESGSRTSSNVWTGKHPSWTYRCYGCSLIPLSTQPNKNLPVLTRIEGHCHSHWPRKFSLRLLFNQQSPRGSRLEASYWNCICRGRWSATLLSPLYYWPWIEYCYGRYPSSL